jgi:putative peptidoglycan lipid II flippase
MSLIKSTATIGSYTLLSRVLGFLRDVTIASSLGASMLSDAFFVAFKLPNVLRRLFAEGAFNSAFVPLYAGMLAGEGKDEAHSFASEAMSFLLVVLIVTAGIFILIMPWLMFLLAPGFDANPTKYALTVTLTRITMPYIIFISLVSLLGGVLNSHNKFAAVAATPVIMNLCLIIIPFFIYRLTPTYAHALAIAVMASGVAQYLWLVWFCMKDKSLPRWVRPRLTEHVRQLLKLIAPVAIGAGAAQINIFIDLSIASFFNGGNSYLYYADRINELPLAVIGIAVGTALLPMLSKQVREGKLEEAHKSQSHAIELALFLSLPAAIALLVIAEQVIHVMYQRGAFGNDAVFATSHTLMAFAFGLPAFILAKIISPAFYAHKDTKTPFKIAMICIGINLFFNLALMFPLQYVGMALATSIAGWANVIMMAVLLQKRTWLSIDRELVKKVIKMLAAALVMACVLYGLKGMIVQVMWSGEITRFIGLLAVVLLGLETYLIAGWVLNIMNIRALVKDWITRK